MKKAGDFLTRHRRLFLFALMVTTLAVSSALNQRRLSGSAELTALPVMRTEVSASSAVAAYTLERDDLYQQDMAALTALVAQEALDSRTREQAAVQLQQMVHDHEAAFALEEALSATSLAPCAAVVSQGSVTIITVRESVTPEESALVLTLAAAHADARAEDVRILPAQ